MDIIKKQKRHTQDIILDMNVECHYNINVIIVKRNILTNPNYNNIPHENTM